jgi:nitroimidazol reductase NimA-like FMN-containing flavoprotein (pyridoxamine 5'-phosphate oxidase superfamily)
MSTPETLDHDIAEGSDEKYKTDICYNVPSPSKFGFDKYVRYEKKLVHSILDDGYFCHIGFIPRDNNNCPDRPVVLPSLYGRVGETLYLHGSPIARLKATVKKLGTDGMLVCVTVTHVDALILARSAAHHGISYRSAVIYGRAFYMSDDIKQKKAKEEALTAIVNQVIPGRSETSRPPNDHELGLTAVLRVEIEYASAKIYNHEPSDDPNDIPIPPVPDQFWAGVLPVREVYGPPISAANLKSDFPVPDHIKKLTGIRGDYNLKVHPDPGMKSKVKFGITDTSDDT